MSLRLTKSQREAVRAMFDGHCAYCGCMLERLWHADHVEACVRKWIPVNGRAVPTGEYERPENNRLDNFMPSCPPCNIDKHMMKLEDWREKLARTLDVLKRNNPTYRHALRFGMLEEKPAPVVFYFERIHLQNSGASRAYCLAK